MKNNANKLSVILKQNNLYDLRAVQIKILTAFIFLIFLSNGFAFKEKFPTDLLDKKAPLLNTFSIDGAKVDPRFYKDKVTLLNFMYIGCKPCMIEISTLNKIFTDIKSDKFQMLSIAAHTPEQVKAFLSDSISVYSSVRIRYMIDSIKYKIVAECDVEKQTVKSDEIELMCSAISKKFYVKGYPTTFLIDKNGYVRKVFEGFSLIGKDSVIEKSMKVEIEKLLGK